MSGVQLQAHRLAELRARESESRTIAAMMRANREAEPPPTRMPPEIPARSHRSASAASRPRISSDIIGVASHAGQFAVGMLIDDRCQMRASDANRSGDGMSSSRVIPSGSRK